MHFFVCLDCTVDKTSSTIGNSQWSTATLLEMDGNNNFRRLMLFLMVWKLKLFHTDLFYDEFAEKNVCDVTWSLEGSQATGEGVEWWVFQVTTARSTRLHSPVVGSPDSWQNLKNPWSKILKTDSKKCKSYNWTKFCQVKDIFVKHN